LRRFAPDVVISAEMGLRTLQASVYTSLHNVPLIIWWEGTVHSEGWAKSKQGIRRYMARRATRFWSNGSECSRLLVTYGVSSKNIDGPMIGTDTRKHWDEVQKAFARRDAIRSSLGVQGTTFLFVGRFHRSKGIAKLLYALERLETSTTAKFSVVFIGDGPERPTLDEWRARHPMLQVQILDFQQPEQLFAFYAACDVLVLPTLEDNWSLVALEAAAAGMPQVFSSCNGASSDLQSLQAHGVCVDPRNIESLAAALKDYAENRPAWAPQSTTKRVVSFFSSEAWVRRACDSIESALATRLLRV
jgi:glycosyltransferase involved in cell wall biosynthesis